MNDNRIYWVRGNTQELLIPLEQEIVPQEGEVEVVPYYPDAEAIVQVRLVGKYRKLSYTPTVDGNLLRLTENATLPSGVYGVEVVVENPDGTRYRSLWDNQIVVTDQNDSVLQEWDEFRQLDVKARAALFFFAKGDKGEKGDRGEKGEQGEQGIQGEKGEQGERGEQGIQGEQGVQGERGEQGIQGEKGEKGDKGDTGNGIASVTQNADFTLTIRFTDGTSYTTDVLRGAKGEQGDTGDAGNGITNAVLNADYTLTITFTDGTSYTTQSIRGDKGDKGDKGDAGTTDYNNLENKPDLSIYMQEVSQEQFDEIFNN